MDTANRRPQLPALSYLDVDKVKREEEAYQSRHSGQTLPPVSAASPTYHYPPGPPPPYSQPHPATTLHANTWSSTHSGRHTPPESRRTSGDEQDAKHIATRQSLPSISEALGVDQTSYPPSAPMVPPAVSAHQSHPQSTALASPLSATKRYAMEPPPAPQNQHAHGGTYPAYSQSYAPHEPSRQALAPQDRPPLHVQTSQPAPPQPQQPTYSYPASTSPGYEQPPSQPSGPMAPPQSFSYGYTPYPPRYAQPTPPSSTSTGPIYQPSANFPAPPVTPSASWKSENSARYPPSERDGAGDYSASVKRHLDLYDLEGALNEISQTGGILMDFSRRYGDRLHHTARSGTPLQSLPGLIEIDDMVAKSRQQVESLLKIREVVLTQQAAYDQQIADQRQQHKGLPEPAASGQGLQDDLEDSKAGFAGADGKKRRGRAAPPGRCHSCNRAETPEWRRGPDGARTLCNACGLHYAKLTRKQQGSSKSSNVGSSNLRPKES